MRYSAWLVLIVFLFALTPMVALNAQESGVEESPVVETPDTNPSEEAQVSANPPVAEENFPLAEKIAVISIEGVIDYGLQKSLERRVDEAIDEGATLLIFEMDTYGGGLFAGIEIGDLLNNIKNDTEGKVHTLAYIRKKAISAGAMASLACQRIVMQSGTSIGDCEAISVDVVSGTSMTAPEKIQTVVRATMRKYAQSNGYPELIVEAMVNPALEVYQLVLPDGQKKYVLKEDLDTLSSVEKTDAQRTKVVSAGHLLTMTDEDARKWDISSASVSGLDEVLKTYGTSDYTMMRYDTNWSEGMARFLASPGISLLLIIAGVLALYFAFKTPGMGVPELVALVCFSTLFLSKHLVGLASVFDIVIFAVGIVLLAVEIFLIPGFGVTGIAGIICIVVSLVLASQKFIIPENADQMRALLVNVLVVMGGMLGATLIFTILLAFLPKAPFLNRLVLATTQQTAEGYVVGSASKRELVGKTGIAMTTLRPSGKAEIEGQTLIVMSENEFLECGDPVIVTKVDGNRIVVTKKT